MASTGLRLYSTCLYVGFPVPRQNPYPRLFTLNSSKPMKRTIPSARSAWLLLALALSSESNGAETVSGQAATGGRSGTIAGFVSNAATGNLLEGARVEVPQLGPHRVHR